MSYIKINNLKINYVIKNNNSNITILFLHGWGKNLESFNNVIKYIDYNYILIDLPGFGKSSILYPLNILEYTQILREFIIKLKLNNLIIVGHSFGGRIALKYASKYDLLGLILVDSAGIKPKRNIWYYLKIYLYKILKKCKIKNNFGSNDYKNANNIMKQTLIYAVNEDLVNVIKDIKVKTILIWGVNDNITPIKDAILINKLLKNSILYKIPNANHFPFNDNINLFMEYFNMGVRMICS